MIAVADHLANATDIVTDNFNAVEAKSYLQGKGFNIQINQEKCTLVITADDVIFTDESFIMNNLSFGDNYKPFYTCFKDVE